MQSSSARIFFPLIPVLDKIIQAGSTKGLTSATYRVLLDRSLLYLLIRSRAGWEKDISSIPEEVWDDILRSSPRVSLSPLHRLTQIFILYRIYRTPQFLYAIGLKSKPVCARCGNTGTLIHLLWHCPNLQKTLLGGDWYLKRAIGY